METEVKRRGKREIKKYFLETEDWDGKQCRDYPKKRNQSDPSRCVTPKVYFTNVKEDSLRRLINTFLYILPLYINFKRTHYINIVAVM